MEGEALKPYDVIKTASSLSGISLIDAGRSMGKRDNYISNKRNASIGIDNYAAIMHAFGYALVAVPADEVPAGALVVDPGDDNQQGDALEAMRIGLEEGSRIRRALEAGKISEATAGAACSAPPNGSGYRAVPRGRKDQTQ